MRKAILGAASALALASPAVAADLQVTPYSENPGYEQEVPPYAYGTARRHTRYWGCAACHCSAAASGGL